MLSAESRASFQISPGMLLRVCYSTGIKPRHRTLGAAANPGHITSGVRIFACTAIALLYGAFGVGIPDLVTGAIPNGAGFGVFLWAATAAPVTLEAALFVNWHRGFVVGLLLDWLVLCVVAGVFASVAKRIV